MKILRILELSWLFIAIAGVVAGTYKWLTEGLNQAVFIYGISVIATVFFIIRRKQRMSMEKQDAAR